MAQRTNIVINDGQTTPVAHTFSPTQGDKPNVVPFYDRSLGVAVGYPMITTSLRNPIRPPISSKGGVNPNGNYRARLVVSVPALDVTAPASGTGIQPAPSKAYESTAIVEFILPERSSLANRRDVLAYARNLLASASVTSMVHDFEAIW